MNSYIESLKESEEKRQHILSLRTENPDMTLNDIGRSVGLTRERVRQILKKANLPTSSQTYSCDGCGAHVSKNRYETYGFCVECLSLSRVVYTICPTCGKSKKRNKGLVIYMTTRPRPQNGKITEAFYCNRECLGSHNGKVYGWGKNILTEQEKESILRLSREHCNVQQIASSMLRSRQTVKKFLDEHKEN